jgi:hypothetical protein
MIAISDGRITLVRLICVNVNFAFQAIAGVQSKRGILLRQGRSKNFPALLEPFENKILSAAKSEGKGTGIATRPK